MAHNRSDLALLEIANIVERVVAHQPGDEILQSAPLNFLPLVVSLLLLASCGAQKPAEESAFYPGKLGIAKAKNLSPRGREIEARFAVYRESHTDEAIASYKQKYGKEINTDNARELSPDYAPGGMDAEDAATRAARAQWSAAVHEPSSALTK